MPDVDAVYLAVPHDRHAGMAIAAIVEGKSVLVEKPIARTPAEGALVVQRAREYGAKVGVNCQYRYDAGCYALAQAVRAVLWDASTPLESMCPGIESCLASRRRRGTRASRGPGAGH